MASGKETWESRGHLFVVADGMGAHAAGELASKLATDIVPLTYFKLKDVSPPEALLTAVHEANNQIHARGSASDDFKGMGTTISTLALLPQGSLVAQVGDSRVYRWRSHRLEQLTFDHSLVWELRASGQLPEGAVPNYVPKNIITRSLGPNAQVQIDLEGPSPVYVGDTFLLCSDGLSGQVADDEIGKILGCMAPDEAVRSLVDLANLRGGPDNITVIVVRVTAPLVPPEKSGASDSARPRPARPVHPAVWSLLGICALAALASVALGFWLLSAVAAVAAAISGIVAAVQRNSGGGTVQFNGRPLGKGPYTTCDCQPDAGFAARLAQIGDELRQAASSEQWNVDWNTFNTLFTQAGAAAQAGNYPESIQLYCQAVSFMMNEVKNQRGRRRPGNSSVLDFG